MSSEGAALLHAALAATVLAGVFLWAYWQVLVKIVDTWNREPDYSHDFLVLPVGLVFLWVRRDCYPGRGPGLAWPGLVLLLAGIGVRLLGSLLFLDALAGWSILLWLGGIVWFLAGWRAFWWSLPSIAFLGFAVPLPFRVERGLSVPLQGIATKLSCWMLQALGQPSIAEHNVIHVGDYRLEVAEACSGLRVFMGIAAVAFAYVVLVRRPWWEKAILVASVVPVALLANATRIVGTGLAYTWFSEEAAHEFMHTLAGWVMIPYSALLFGLVAWYVSKLVSEVDVVDVGSVVRQEGGP